MCKAPSLCDRRYEAYFHVCKILVETVEAYVQQSGVLWRVILCISEREGATKEYVTIDNERSNKVEDDNKNAINQ